MATPAVCANKTAWRPLGAVLNSVSGCVSNFMCVKGRQRERERDNMCHILSYIYICIYIYI